MTEVEQQPPPQNGIDLSAAEEDDNSKARPADIEQDMREMERRKRVEAIMGSKLFREELERIVDSARDGGGILQQLSDIMGVPTSTRVGNVFKATNCMLPINDIRGVESMGYAKGEKILRCKLAATFRLLDLYGWTQGFGAQITARLKVDQENFLVNPYGMMYHEITASSLNRVDMQGQIVEQGTTNFGVNKTHFALHSVVHAARPDIRCAIYIGCTPVVAVSSLKVGLLPITRDACVLGDVTTHTYTGTQMDSDERDRLVRALGPNSKVLILSNYGALCCGETIEEAFFAASHIVKACETQLQLLPVGVDNLVFIPEESRKAIYIEARRPPEDLEKKFAAAVATVEAANAEAAGADGAAVATKSTVAGGAAPKWRVGGAEFEALMRMLDNAGYRTGYIYRHPLIKSDPPKPKNDVELPPAVSSLGYLLEEEELLKQGIWKKGDFRKGGDRSRWLNSPNVYQKVEVLETGTPDPKKITKWVAESSPTHSTPVRIEDALQFVPPGTNPKEFKRLQQQIKDNRRADKISAGPQSHILEGVTWDEAARIKDATVSSAGDHVVLMGAASKGIIQRGYQHNAAVYKAPYAKNPFDNVTDDELNEYKRTVERKKKSIHGEYTDTDFSESEPLSSMPISAPQQTKQTTITTAAVSQSEPEDVSEHQVMRIQTQQAPIPSQPEVVLSDAGTFHQPNHSSPATSTQIHKTHIHQQSYEPFSTHKYFLLLNNFEKYANLARKYDFLYKTTTTSSIATNQPTSLDLGVLNVWMIHKIEIFPHYTYPLPTDVECGEAKLHTHKAKYSFGLGETEETRLLDERGTANDGSTKKNLSTATITSTTTTITQPYRTCSHYGFNYPITYQPNITIHPANLLTAVQLQREKVIAFIKSTAMSLNTSYFSQQQHLQIQSERQPRAPRLKSCALVTELPASTCIAHNASSPNAKVHNTDSNGSYISVKEIKLEPAKRRGGNKFISESDHCESLASRNRQHSEHDPEDTTTQHPDTQQQDVLSEHFSSLLSIGGTSYPAESHSHNGDLAHEHDEEDEEEHENEECSQHQHYDDSADNASSIYRHTATPTTQRASYMLRDFLPAHAQSAHEIPEHKPESEQELVQASTKAGTKLLQTSANKMPPDDEYSDDGSLHTPRLPRTHHSHKQIKLTLNSNTTSLKRRCSSHSSQEAAVNIALSPPERYRRHVTASLSEADSSLSAAASSSLRSLEIHININVKNSDCARTLQTHEAEFRRKLERIIDDEINLIAQQLSDSAQYVSSNHVESGGGVHIVPKPPSSPTTHSLLTNLPHHHHHHLLHLHTLPHMETLNDLRLVGTLAASEQQANKYRHNKLAKRAHLQPESQQQHQQEPGQEQQASTQSPPPPCPASEASSCSGANDSWPQLKQRHRQMLAMLEQELESLLNGIICANALHNHAVMCDCKMKVAQLSQELRASLSASK